MSRRRRYLGAQSVLTLDGPLPFVIYLLCDPRVTDPVLRVRYVGVTKDPKSRLKAHIAESKRGKVQTYKCNWIRHLISFGLLPEMDIIDPGSDGREWDKTEIAWIKYYRDLGCPLTNATVGGIGAYLGTGAHPSSEIREKKKNAALLRMSESRWNRTCGDIIRDAREARGISQEGLADSLHVSRAYLSMVESGARPITEETALRLADLLGIDRLVLLVAAVSGSRWPVLGRMAREMGHVDGIGL